LVNLNSRPIAPTARKSVRRSALNSATDIDALRRVADSQESVYHKNSMEPTTRLELVTCRLRIDPVLRMLLSDKNYTRALWGVLGRFSDHLYSSCTAGRPSRFQIVADQIKSRTRKTEAGPVGKVVAKGKMEIGFQQISELLLGQRG
jgi:hypothetical protein